MRQIIDMETYRQQRLLQHRCSSRYPERGTADDHAARCLQLADEVHEVLNLMHWKPHRRGEGNEKVIDRDKLLDELVDVFKFFMNVMHIHDVCVVEFEEAYMKKHAIVLQRLKEEGL